MNLEQLLDTLKMSDDEKQKVRETIEAAAEKNARIALEETFHLTLQRTIDEKMKEDEQDDPADDLNIELLLEE